MNGDKTTRVEGRRDRKGVSFFRLVAHNVAVKKLRFALTAVAIGIGVTTVLTFGIVSQGLQTSAFAILQTGEADFTIAQKGVSDIVNSSINAGSLPKVAAERGVASVTGVLLSTVRLNADNPLFLEIGIRPSDLGPFGVHILAGRAFVATASNEVLLGWRAADNLGMWVNGRITIGDAQFRVVGIYSTGQSLGDTGAMLPLSPFQAAQRQSGQLTLLFVRVEKGTNVSTLQTRIESEFPQLVAIRTLAQFGRADRSYALINAASDASAILAIVIGAVVVLSAMSMSFIERIKEFGVLAAVGWPRWRVAAMILSESLLIGLVGAMIGLILSVIAVNVLENLPSLAGAISVDYTPAIFGRALYVAAAMSVLGALYPALRASRSAPLEELRHE